MKSHVVPGVELRAVFGRFRKDLGILQPVVAMSRRKQSNPKPLKREDEEENCQPGEAVATVKSEPANSPAPPRTPPPRHSPTPPRVRLNISLATDPGAEPLRVGGTSPPQAVTASPRSASTPPIAVARPNAPGLGYLAALQPAFHHALATAGRLFPTPLPEADVTALAKPTAVRPKIEPTGATVESRTVYMCAPCGIRFSSASTLEAHQTYYCSHRVQPKGRESDGDEPKSPSGSEGPTPAKAPRTGKQYGCPHCSYSADKKVSLNRHMRMHAASPATSNGDADVPVDRYCQDCDIRFSSVKTLKAHKMHYCGSRHGKASPASKASSAPASPSSPTRVSPESQPFLMLHTDPVLIVPYSLLQNASVFTGASTLPSQDTACVVLQDGTVQPMSHLVQGADDASAVLRLRGERNARRDAASPLDLSVRRDSDPNLIDEDEKENVFSSSPHEDIVCAPSIPALLGEKRSPRSPGRKSDSYSTSPSPPSPVRKSSWRAPNGLCKEPKGTTPTPDQVQGSILPLLNDLPLRVGGLVGGQLTNDTAVPQVLVKQGVSKCQECNIVFCKHENYVAHKKHYCSARASDTGDDGSRTISPGSKSPGSVKDSTDGASPGPGKAATLYQFICVACGIKYTALDNLTAHQAYYCPKRSEPTKAIDEKPRRCAKCKVVTSGEHQCLSPVAGWKCPCCDVISPTAASAQKHMEAHTGVRAFRCTICRYKGNTLRGMRTHIRMHFDKKNLDLQEENFISCIVDEENAPNGDVAVAAVTVAPVPTPSASEPLMPPLPVVVVKEETAEDELVDVEADPVPPSHPGDSGTDVASRPGVNHCQTCDITFNYTASYLAHKKFYCANNARTRSPRTATPETSVQ